MFADDQRAAKAIDLKAWKDRRLLRMKSGTRRPAEDAPGKAARLDGVGEMQFFSA
jgi:hypothetical protein